jgi:hypothetical protein
MAKQIPEVYRCHVTMRGKCCPCEITVANTYTFSLLTLDRKAAAKDGEKVTIKTIEDFGLCPWHANFLKMVVGRRDIVPMKGVAELVLNRDKKLRQAALRQEKIEASTRRHETFVMSRQSALAAAFIQAGLKVA